MKVKGKIFQLKDQGKNLIDKIKTRNEINENLSLNSNHFNGLHEGKGIQKLKHGKIYIYQGIFFLGNSTELNCIQLNIVRGLKYFLGVYI